MFERLSKSHKTLFQKKIERPVFEVNFKNMLAEHIQINSAVKRCHGTIKSTRSKSNV